MKKISYDTKNEYITPDWIIEYLQERFGRNFDLDVCASKDNAKCKRFYTEDDNALEQVWTGHVWCNPPYTGKYKIEAFIRKAINSNIRSATFLLPAHKTEQKWWEICIAEASHILWIQGRVKFQGEKSCATFPSVVVRFDDFYFHRLCLHIIDQKKVLTRAER